MTPHPLVTYLAAEDRQNIAQRGALGLGQHECQPPLQQHVVDALLTVDLAHAGERVGCYEGHGYQRTCQTTHERLIKLQPIFHAEIVEKDIHRFARLAHVGG